MRYCITLVSIPFAGQHIGSVLQITVALER